MGLIQWQESRIAANILAIRDQEETLAKLREKTWGVTYHEGRNRKFLVLPSGVKGKQLDGGEEERSKTGQGVSEYDRAGNALTERLRAIAAGLYAAAERLGERLHGFAAYVRADTTGERATEEQCDDLSQQVQRLAGQVDRLSRLFITNSR